MWGREGRLLTCAAKDFCAGKGDHVSGHRRLASSRWLRIEAPPFRKESTKPKWKMQSWRKAFLGCWYIIQGVLTVELQLVDCLLEKHGCLLLFTTLSCSMLFPFEFPFLAEFSSTLRLFATKKWRVSQQKESEKGILIIIMTISLLSKRKKTFLLVHLQAPPEIIKNFFLSLFHSFCFSQFNNKKAFQSWANPAHFKAGAE